MSSQKKYVPPNRRSKQRSEQSKSRGTPTQKVDTQNTMEFPELGKQHTKHTNINECGVMNYVNATRVDEKTVTSASTITPGWVNLYRNTTTTNGKVRMEYGEKNKEAEEEDTIEDTYSGLTASQAKGLKHLVNRWQTHRDVMNDYLDQDSPYWGMKHLDDPLSDDDFESENESDQNESSDELDDMDMEDAY